ncbi:long-chain fatty acid--CoA ligase [Erwinia sp. S59]|uniref:LuxE/PaaK family acyltransferase n=1 Tax=Erwinia sp. S59 TaxID=2769340 RepID=UPI00190BD918|nr:long-chain fatty acid--CoA ligase [Erwinia sp. S59]MBK0089949.1 long-chain fatty acid--CoA ligase [Erwinia sp. S59]
MTEAALIDALLTFLQRQDTTDDDFNRMALAVFAYQFERNLPYRRFAMQRGRTPFTVKNWRAIPAIPITAFKDLTLSCHTSDDVEAVFMTSGTTGTVKGRSYHPTLDVWKCSMTQNFRQRFMAGDERIRMGILFPDNQVLPNSSLAHYLTLAMERFGTAESEVLLDDSVIAMDRLFAALEQAEARDEPYALLGASYSFVHLLDEMQRQGRGFTLPVGSRILDTSGFKGQSREIEAEQFYTELSAALGVPRTHCINMYGMTELSSQFYDDGNVACPSVKSGPHWIRTRVVNPLSGEEVAEGEIGVLVHHDLAHFNSVSALLTEDAGRAVAGGFHLLGRVTGADAKGCSLAMEEFLAAAQGAM